MWNGGVGRKPSRASTLFLGANRDVFDRYPWPAWVREIGVPTNPVWRLYGINFPRVFTQCVFDFLRDRRA